ncbi:MAG: TlpA disulfide reductase family protein [candidate division Zixibacteria bacterium]|nr:TlpA disulfide reductase family protein [candidate division Zixibacteria bacterium]
MRRFITTLILFLTTLLVSCGSSEKQTQRYDSSPDLSGKYKSANQTASSTAISFTAYDINGTLHNSNEWIGKQPVIINIWGTWCPPCRKEIPDLIRLYGEYRPKGVEILGLAVKDSPQKVDLFSSQNGMEWVMMMADRNLMISLRATRGVPTTIFLDSTGKEVTRFVGPRSYDVFREAFEAIL